MSTDFLLAEGFIDQNDSLSSLTVASLFGGFLPRDYFSLISSSTKFQGANSGAIKVPGNTEILIGSLTGSEPDMVTSDRISDPLRVWGIRTSFRFHYSTY